MKRYLPLFGTIALSIIFSYSAFAQAPAKVAPAAPMTAAPTRPAGPDTQHGDILVYVELPQGGTTFAGLSWFKENKALAYQSGKWPSMKGRYLTVFCENQETEDTFVRRHPQMKCGKRYKVVSIEYPK